MSAFETGKSIPLGMIELYWYRILIVGSKSLITYVFSKATLTSCITAFELMLYKIFTIVNGNTSTMALGPCLTWIKPRSTSTIAPIFIKNSNLNNMSTINVYHHKGHDTLYTSNFHEYFVNSPHGLCDNSKHSFVGLKFDDQMHYAQFSNYYNNHNGHGCASIH